MPLTPLAAREPLATMAGKPSLSGRHGDSDAAGAEPTASVAGTLVFGIGTASNNGLGSAQIYTTDAQGSFITVYQGKAYPGSYLDTGTSVLALLDPVTLGIPLCAATPPPQTQR